MDKMQAYIKDGRWKWYPTHPSQMRGSEKTVYRHIEDISNAVLEAAGSVMGSSTKLTAKVVRNSYL